MVKRKGAPVRIRRNVQQNGDPYLPDINPGEIAVCTGCHAIFRRRHWFFDEALYGQLTARPDTRLVTCPACRKEILNLIRNEEERAKGINPLERIIHITEEHGKIVVQTTNEKLAQRIGREVGKAYQGKTNYRWSEDTKLLRVTWTRE
jgi:hypothetical protein